MAAATGVSEHTLRAWERRYGIPRPERSRCHYRLYEHRDVELIQAMRRLIARGVKPSMAAERARLEVERCPDGVDCDGLRAELLAALLDEDEARVHAVFGVAAQAFNSCRLVADVIAPVMYGLGAAWARGETGVDVEHWASATMRSRVEALTAQVEPACGKLAVLACAPGERHELPILCLRLRLANHGWRSHVLGCDLPVDDLAGAAVRLRPEMVALSVTGPARRQAALDAAVRVREAVPGCTVVVGGQGVGTAPLPPGIGSEADFWALIEGSARA